MLLADLGWSADATALFRVLIDAFGPQSIGKEGRFAYTELRVGAGETGDLPALLDSLHIRRDDAAQPALLSANAVNPFNGRAASESRWHATMKEMFEIDGLESIEVRPGDEAPFDRVASSARRSIDGGPLVTVVIPTYAPGPRLNTAIESLLAQSYTQLQILIMDDASPADAAVELAKWSARDPRIEVVHLGANNGPYLARNIAVARHARGDYITIHDDDDWSHPRRIERQVLHLESEADAVANMCNGVRATDDLQFCRVNGNPVWTQQALSSLMVRRSVFAEIGYWDVINRSADAEFNDRIRSWTQARIPVVGRVPLMFYRTRSGSLSGGEFRRGYMDPRRRWYYQSYTDWHESQRAAGVAPYVPADNRGCRAFSAPYDFLGSRSDGMTRPITLDVIVIGDFRSEGAQVEYALATVENELARGGRVGIMQLDSPHNASTRIDSRILRAAMHQRACVVSLLDVVVARLAVVCDTSVFDFLSAQRSAIEVRRVKFASFAPVAELTRRKCDVVLGVRDDGRRSLG